MITRVLTSIVALGALAAVVLLGDEVDPHPVPQPEATYVDVTPVEQPVACPGPLAVPVGDVVTGDDVLDSGSRDRALAFYAPGEQTRTDSGTGIIVDAPVATTVERVGGGDIAGLSGLTCTRPSHDQWLVGGSTQVGSSARLVLTNPTQASIEVTVTLFGPVGQMEEQTVTAVGPLDQREILLEGVEVEVPALVVRVQATGAGIVAHVQDSRLEGIQPAGTDWLVPVRDPADRWVVPGVGPAVGEDANAESVLRLMAPEGATASLTFVTERGIVPWGGTSALELEPGVVVDVAVPPRIFGAIEIDADGEVVAAAMTRLSRPADEGLEGARAFDLAWLPALDNRDGASRSAVMPDSATEVVVYSATTDTFVLRDQDGTVVVEQEIEARTARSLPIDVPPGTVLSAEGRFAWVLRVTDAPGFVSALRPELTEVQEQRVSVMVEDYAPVP